MEPRRLLLWRGRKFVMILTVAAASAISAVAADAKTNELAITPAVRVEFNTEFDVRYEIQVSTNLVNWTNSEPAFRGRNRTEIRSYPAQPGTRQYLRLAAAPLNPAASPGNLSGSMIQLIYPGFGSERFDFTGPNTGTYEGGAAQILYQWDPQKWKIEADRSDNAAHYVIYLSFSSDSFTEGTATVIYTDSASPRPQIDQASFTATGINSAPLLTDPGGGIYGP